GTPEAMRASDPIVSQWRASDALLKADRKNLSDSISSAIQTYPGVAAESLSVIVSLLADACGALIMNGAEFTSAAARYDEGRRTVETHVRQRLQTLNATLSAAGVMEGGQRNALIQEAAKIA